MFLLVPAHPGSPGQRAVKRLCVCVWVCVCVIQCGTDASVVHVMSSVHLSHLYAVPNG